MLHAVTVASNSHFPHRSVAFLEGETVKFSALLPNFVRRLYPKLDDTVKSMRQIRDVITTSVSFTFRENEFAADNKASLSFQSLSNIFILFCCFFREAL